MLIDQSGSDAIDMDIALRVEPRKIEFTTYGPGKAPVWSVTFALHASSGYEHLCTVIVPGHGHDDVTDICGRARAELRRIAALISAPPPDPPEEPAPAVVGKRTRGRRPVRLP